MRFFSAGDIHTLRRNVTRFIAAQPCDGIGSILGQTVARHRDLFDHRGFVVSNTVKASNLVKILILPSAQARRDMVRADIVYGDTVVAQFDRSRAR